MRMGGQTDSASPMINNNKPLDESKMTPKQKLRSMLTPGSNARVIFTHNDVHRANKRTPIPTTPATTTISAGDQQEPKDTPGCLFLIEHLDFHKVYFVWAPYTELAKINSNFLTYTRENGDLVTATSSSKNNGDDEDDDDSNNEQSEEEVAPEEEAENDFGYVSANLNASNPPPKIKIAVKVPSVIVIPLSDISTIKKHISRMGNGYIVIVTSSAASNNRTEYSYPPLFFHDGGIQDFFSALQKIVTVRKAPNDENTFTVNDPQENLQKSLSSLGMNYYVEDVYKSPASKRSTYWKMMEYGSKVSRMLREGKDSIFSVATGSTKTSQQNRASNKSMSSADDDDFEIVKASDLLPDDNNNDKPDTRVAQAGLSSSANNTTTNNNNRTITNNNKKNKSNNKNKKPLDEARWRSYFDAEGRIQNLADLKRDIFHGGVENNIRGEVWKFLLGFYPFDSTFEQRKQINETKAKEYQVLKTQWTSITPAQEARFRKFRERKHRIEKDVVRTDRTHPCYRDDNSPYLSKLFDVLVTYTFYNFDLGYCQGMGDLLSPIAVVIEDEAETFWCFANLMETMERNFQRDQNGMHTQLLQLANLVQSMDSKLHEYLEANDCLNFFFCFRWILVLFKREFDFDQVMKLWEVLWSEHYANKDFHLFVATAILLMHRNKIMGDKMAFDDILKYINDLSGKMDLDKILQRAEDLYKEYETKLNKMIAANKNNKRASASSASSSSPPSEAAAEAHTSCTTTPSTSTPASSTASSPSIDILSALDSI